MRFNFDLELMGHKISFDMTENLAAIQKIVTKTEYFPRVVPDSMRPAKNLIRFARTHTNKEVRVEWCQSLEDALYSLARGHEIVGNEVIFRGRNWKVTLEKRDVQPKKENTPCPTT